MVAQTVNGEALVLVGEKKGRREVGGWVEMVGGHVDEARKATDVGVVTIVVRALVE
jgi:hypothetical protein